MTTVGQVVATMAAGTGGPGGKAAAATGGGDDFSALVAAFSTAIGTEGAVTPGETGLTGTIMAKILVPQAANGDTPVVAVAGDAAPGVTGVTGLLAGAQDGLAVDSGAARAALDALSLTAAPEKTGMDSKAPTAKAGKSKAGSVEAESTPDAGTAASLLALIGGQLTPSTPVQAATPRTAKSSSGDVAVRLDGATGATQARGAEVLNTIGLSQQQQGGNGAEPDGQASGGDADPQAAPVPIPESRDNPAQTATVAPPAAPSGVSATSAAIGAATDVGVSLSDTVIDMGVGGQWIDRMATEINRLAEGAGHSRFQLSPPHLGRIQVDIWQGVDGGRVQMLAETDEAARRLSDGQSTLQADARLQALSLGSISIQRAPEGSFDTARDPGANAQQQQQTSSQGQPQRQESALSGQSGGSAGTGQQPQQQSQQQGAQADHGKASPRPAVLDERSDRADRSDRSRGRDDAPNIRYA